ncbi:MAG: UDP-N-acetylmuramate dehydrogenase [Candidatus Omnitrophica bacterium]|nr:UDP-N-acetylmuramate dehydrogenase [Candidatus Omnitrophota bacterium]MBU4488629.1 UDP-N-acetylmuramate dehydrogenase [Candidatus Omnitrophota bacterium]MCG2705892.1 UDP-N-acetylmuramate dehydrogenase [Candidatus Omnitrophota bacterium]
MITESLIDVKDFVKGRVLYNEPMKRHTSFKVGGPAEIWIEPDDIDDLRSCLSMAKERNLPVLIVGSGTNLLVRDEGIKGLVISMTSPRLKKIYHGDFKVAVSSAVQTREFLHFLREHNLSGLEFLAGVPGTIGGAVAMNAGVRHYAKKDTWNSVGDFVEEVKAYDFGGNKQIFSKKELNFGYRSSNLRGLAITEIKFRLKKDDKENIAGECNNYLRKKQTAQDLSLPSAGCVFKNPEEAGVSAGELIDRCGLKGRRSGGALISPKHANFIINTGNATCGDIIELISIAKSEVKKKFGVELEPEIKIV